MKERFFAVPKGQQLERINPLTTKEMVDVVAGALCRCASCQDRAKPVLERNPLMQGMDRKRASMLWEGLKLEAKRGRKAK